MSAIRDAAARAVAFAQEVYGNGAVQNTRVEEVERDGTLWHITLSWSDPTVVLGGIAFSPRVYKQFDVVTDTGEVKAMRIRNVE